MKFLVSSFFVLLSGLSFGQEAFTPRADKDFRIEYEPASAFLKGFALGASYNVTKHDDVNLGVYFATLEIPKWVQANAFIGTGDSTDTRLGFEAAVMIRHKLNMFKNWESNPYVGMHLGWEYFDVYQPNMDKLTIQTFIATPYIGFEWYVYKMFYINPQARGVYYFGKKKSDPDRPETIRNYVLPQVALGIRL